MYLQPWSVATPQQGSVVLTLFPLSPDLERDMFEDLTRWMTEEVRILETGVRDRVHQLEEMVPLLTSNTGFDQERVHYVKVRGKQSFFKLPQKFLKIATKSYKHQNQTHSLTIFITGVGSSGSRDQ